MPRTGFRLLVSPKKFRGVKWGGWIMHQAENRPCYGLNHSYKALLIPLSWWWLRSLCNSPCTPTTTFFFFNWRAVSGIQLCGVSQGATVPWSFPRQMAVREDRRQPVPAWPLTFLSQDPASMSGTGVMRSICCGVSYRGSEQPAWGSWCLPATPIRGVLMLSCFFLCICFPLWKMHRTRNV